MRHVTKALLGLLMLALLPVTGCQKKLNEEKNYTLLEGEVKALQMDEQPKDQRITITVTATGSPINLHVVKESGHAAAMEALQFNAKLDPAIVIESKSKIQSETLVVTVPAKTGFSVMISGAKKKTDVNLKVTNR